jgi:xanthine dehydrogenase small subunit
LSAAAVQGNTAAIVNCFHYTLTSSFASNSVTTSIRFLLDGELTTLVAPAPTRTVLQYLREDLARTGTKEGCAEGDCGACTVVIAERVPAVGGSAQLRYRAVNACIQFLPSLDGKALLTVESLRRGGALHPVQQAMVDCHGAQCGFCTPGFVMSLFALYKTQSDPDRRAINDALAGNLCRCTGYRPIVDAACSMYELGRALPDAAQDWIGASADVQAPAALATERTILKQLESIDRASGVAFEHAEGTFHAPRSLDELAALCETKPNARIVAGSTDVGLWVTKQHRALGDLIYTGAVRDLARIERTATHLEIGAAVTVTDAMGPLAEQYADADELFRRYGSPPIRNAGTLGGNVANGSPIGDSMPFLIAVGAEVVLRKGYTTRTLALESFYLDYQKTALAKGEFVQAVRVPLGRPGQWVRVYKISKRFDQDISALCGAFAIEVVGGNVRSIRIAFGGMAAIPKRALKTEAVLLGQAWNDANVARAVTTLQGEFTPLTDMRASAEYRRKVAANLLRKFFVEASNNVDRAATRLYV